MANKLKLERFVANEIKLIEEILKGKELPSYYSVRDVTKKLFKYYVEEEQIQIDEAIKNICNFLDSKSILYSKKEINSLAEWYDPKKSTPLRRGSEPLVFTKTDQEILMSLNKREEQRLLFGFMLIAKFQKLYTKMQEPNKIYYDINSVGALVGMNVGAVRRGIKEIGLCGFILAPLEQNCMIVNCLSNGNEKEVLSIYDFEPSMNIINDIFIQLVGKQEQMILAIPLDDQEDYLIFNSVNKTNEYFETKGSNISNCCRLKRLSFHGYMFFPITEDDDEEFLQFVVHYYQNNISINYRRDSKSGALIGTKVIWCNPNIIREIYNKFMKAIEEQ